MRIIRAARRKSFTIMANSVIDDGRLSYRALGLLTYLLSKPDGWETDSTVLSDGRKEGRDAVRTAMRELQSAGYMVLVRVQGGSGRWSTEAHLTDRPGQATEDGFSVPGVTSTNGVKPQVAPKTGKPTVGFPGRIPKNGTQGLSTEGGHAAPSPPCDRNARSRIPTDQHDPLTAVPDHNDTKQVTSSTRARNSNRPILAIVDNAVAYSIDDYQLTIPVEIPTPAEPVTWEMLGTQLDRINSTSTGAAS